VLTAIGLQRLIPESLALRTRWLAPAVEFTLLTLLVAASPQHVARYIGIGQRGRHLSPEKRRVERAHARPLQRCSPDGRPAFR
jgi:hypothetical protein